MSSKTMTPDEILQAYATAPDDLEAALRDLSDSNLDLARGPDKWTIREIVHHIVDSDAIVTAIIMAGLGNSGCTYDQKWYPTDNSWATALAYQRRSVETALALFRAHHNTLVELIRLLPDARERFVIFQWERDPEGSRITVGNLIHSRVHHCRHHIAQIQATRQVHGKS